MPKTRKKRGRVAVPQPTLSNEKIKFSFEFYDEERPEYCLSDWSSKQIKKALQRLKDINTKSFNELRHNDNRRVYHFNEVDWGKTIEKDGFSDSRVKELPPFHFALLGINGQLTRVYGAYYKGVFYIIWFDLDHKIWPSLLKNT